jgi:hypothetical protein
VYVGDKSNPHNYDSRHGDSKNASSCFYSGQDTNEDFYVRADPKGLTLTKQDGNGEGADCKELMLKQGANCGGRLDPKRLMLMKQGGNGGRADPNDLRSSKNYNSNNSSSRTQSYDKLRSFYEHSDKNSSNNMSSSSNSSRTVYGGVRGHSLSSDVYSSSRKDSNPGNSQQYRGGGVGREGERGGGRAVEYNKPLPPSPMPDDDVTTGRYDGLTSSQRRAVPNDYVPSRIVDKMRHSDRDVKNDVRKNVDVREERDDVSKRFDVREERDDVRKSFDVREERDDVSKRFDVREDGDGGGGGEYPQYGEEDLKQCREELTKRLAGERGVGVRGGVGGERGEGSGSSPPPDDGYGTCDSRSSSSTATVASPLSSSLSSLITATPSTTTGDSSTSLNGSQRLPAGNGSGVSESARVQPVSGSGRLVVGRRPILVKRRDLPPVDMRSDYGASLEERLRALTTIEEEDAGLSSSTAALVS